MMAGRPFFNIAGIGFDARVAKHFNNRAAGRRVHGHTSCSACVKGGGTGLSTIASSSTTILAPCARC